MTEQALRDTMVMLGASLFQRGYATGGAGNLSVSIHQDGVDGISSAGMG